MCVYIYMYIYIYIYIHIIEAGARETDNMISETGLMAIMLYMQPHCKVLFVGVYINKVGQHMDQSWVHLTHRAVSVDCE